ncbi:CPBP family intramembrane glutamic endopeptidase [Acidipila rosea]|nr:CPBP family intramembrane glutamic endopeptidase [Acidipila rosea]
MSDGPMYDWAEPGPPAPALQEKPHFGHAALFFLVALPLLAAGQYLSLVIAHALPVYRHKSYSHLVHVMASDARLGIPAQALAYLLVGLVTVLLFRLLWREPFSIGIHWNGQQAQRRFLSLVVIGLLVGFGNTIIGNYLPMPKDPPILMDMMKSPGGAWLMLVFGITAAPLLEELAFRGFLLPGFVNTFRWLMHKDDISRSTLNWVGIPVSILLTSLPFAMLHAGQVSGAWGPLLLIGGVSVVLCVVRLLTDSLAASAVVHAAYNFTLFAGILIQTDGFRHLGKLKG